MKLPFSLPDFTAPAEPAGIAVLPMASPDDMTAFRAAMSGAGALPDATAQPAGSGMASLLAQVLVPPDAPQECKSPEGAAAGAVEPGTTAHFEAADSPPPRSSEPLRPAAVSAVERPISAEPDPMDHGTPSVLQPMTATPASAMPEAAMEAAAFASATPAPTAPASAMPILTAGTPQASAPAKSGAIVPGVPAPEAAGQPADAAAPAMADAPLASPTDAMKMQARRRMLGIAPQVLPPPVPPDRSAAAGATAGLPTATDSASPAGPATPPADPASPAAAQRHEERRVEENREENVRAVENVLLRIAGDNMPDSLPLEVLKAV